MAVLKRGWPCFSMASISLCSALQLACGVDLFDLFCLSQNWRQIECLTKMDAIQPSVKPSNSVNRNMIKATYM